MARSDREARLILVRHGETVWNVQDRVQGHQDSPLTERGREQTARAAKRLAKMDIAAVYSSDTNRARETGRFIAAPHGLAVRPREDLRERSYGVLEGLTLEEAAERDSGWLERWRADRLRLAPPGGESQPELCRRVMAALREIAAAHAGEAVIVATHGGPIKSAVFAALDIPISSWDLTWVANGSITVLRGTPEVLRVAAYNDICHLEVEPSGESAIES